MAGEDPAQAMIPTSTESKESSEVATQLVAPTSVQGAAAAAAAAAEVAIAAAAAVAATEAREEKDTNKEGIKKEEEDDDDEPSGGAMSADVAKALKKRKERLEQNRISARESRKRKKTMIEELQRTVITLSKENKELNDRNEQLRSQLMEIGRKYPNVVPIQTIMNGAPPPAPQPPSRTSIASTMQQQVVPPLVAASTAVEMTNADSIPPPAP